MKVRIKNVKFLIMGLLLIQPQYFGTIDAIDRVYDIALPLLFIYLIYKHITLGIFNNALFFQSLFYVTIAIPTIIHSGDIGALTIVVLQVMTLSMFANYGCNAYGVSFLYIAGSVYFLLALVNLVTMFFFPSGLFNLEAVEHSWFLGHKNTLIKYLIPGLYSFGLASLIERQKFRITWYIYLVVAVITTLIGGSSTSLVALFVFSVCYFVRNKQWKAIKIVNFYAPLIYNFAFFVLIVVFRMQDKFAYLIENVLGKQLTLTGRTDLWDRMLLCIAVRPLNGYGLEATTMIQERLEYWNVSAHNILTDYLYEGGILCIAVLFLLFAITKKNLDTVAVKYEPVCYFSNAMFLAFSIVWSTDTFVRSNIQGIFFMVVVAYNLSMLVRKEEIQGCSLLN